jgi:hypothetical protein
MESKIWRRFLLLPNLSRPDKSCLSSMMTCHFQWICWVGIAQVIWKYIHFKFNCIAKLTGCFWKAKFLIYIHSMIRFCLLVTGSLLFSFKQFYRYEEKHDPHHVRNYSNLYYKCKYNKSTVPYLSLVPTYRSLPQHSIHSIWKVTQISEVYQYCVIY